MVELLVLGLSLGCIYALAAVGVTLVYQTTGVLNLSHGGAVMLGGVATGFARQEWGVPLWLAGVIGVGIAGLSGLVLAVTVILPLWKRNANNFIVALGTLLFLLIVINAATNLVGTDPKIVPDFGVPGFKGLGISIPGQTILIVVTLIVVILALELFLKRTIFGIAMRAIATDRQASAMLGISPTTFAVVAVTTASLIAGLGGLLIAPVQVAVVGSAHIYNVAGFAAAVLGGLTNVRAAIYGGLVLGLVEAFVALHITTAYLQVVMLSTLIVLLLLRPNGVFSSNEVEVKY